MLALLTGPGRAQVPRPAGPGISLELGPAVLPVTGSYTVAVRLRDAALRSSTPFPEIEGLKKSRKTSTTTTRSVQGRSFQELTITQEYMPYGEGEVVVKPFQMTVNGQVLRSAGATVQVGVAATPPPGPSPGSPTFKAEGALDKLFGKPKPALYQEVPDHAFLALVADRSSVFVGEGVRVGLYFYLLPADQALLAFRDFAEQLPQMMHQLHQPSAWEVAGPPPAAAPDTLRRNDQLYLRFRLAESTYYPLTAEPLNFPALALTMTKFKVLIKPESGVDNRLPAPKTYLAPAVRIAVRPLPPHPDTEAVPVGDYQLQEGISTIAPRTGQTFTYTFGVTGRGNLAAVLSPAFAPSPGLEVYGPTVREVAAPEGGGRKLFRYRLVVRRPGQLRLDSLLRLVVFNPRTAHYDTLRPSLHPLVRGAAQQALPLPKPEDDAFYGPAIRNADAELQPLNVYQQVRRYADWLLLGLLAVAAYGAARAKWSKP